jgi:hypothetical protein
MVALGCTLSGINLSLEYLSHCSMQMKLLRLTETTKPYFRLCFLDLISNWLPHQ